jgi:hypothetical protein
MNTYKKSVKALFFTFSFSFFLAVPLSSCSDSGSSGPADMTSAAADLTFFSCCGQPGDTGNSKGVGRFCKKSSPDCSGTGAVFCSAEAAPQKRAYFCTVPCSGATDTTTCGENASCVADSVTGLYGCVPTACVNNLPAGCKL